MQTAVTYKVVMVNGEIDKSTYSVSIFVIRCELTLFKPLSFPPYLKVLV